MNNPNAADNLKPFKKGKDARRNMKGAPKLPDLKEAISKVLNKVEGGKTSLDEIIEVLDKNAKKGDIRAAQELLDRGFGKAKQFIEQSNTNQLVRIGIFEIKINE